MCVRMGWTEQEYNKQRENFLAELAEEFINQTKEK